VKKTIFALLLVLTIILAGCKTAEPVVDAVNDESAAKIAEMEAALAEAEAKAEEAASASADELAAAQAELEAAQAELDAAKAEMEAAAVEVEEPAAEPVEISWLIFETPALTASFWDEVIANGIKDSGVPGLTVEKFVTPGADRTAYAKQLISAGTVPDLMQSIATQDFVDSGLLQPWDQAWCEEHFIMPMATSIDGKIWQAPTNSQVIPFVFYNKDLFAQVGVEVPTTWAEFQDVVLKLRAAGIKPIQIVGGSDGGWAAAFTLEGIISAEVLGSTPDWAQQRKAGTVKFTDAAMETAFNKYKWLVDNDAFDIADLGVGFGDANSAFGEGKAAMYFMGSWFLQYDAIKDAAFEPGVFLFPREDGKQVVPFSVGGGIHISAESAHPDETNAFARAVALSPSFMKSIIESDGAISMVKGMTVEAYGATVTDVYKEAMNFVGVEGLMNVAAFDWVANDFALAPGMQGEINISAQAIMNGADVMSELQRLDAAWDLASE
jgi:multiple sugar transport system substrate-binding protein/raffinose/stachyose/melibiose transport system substrate-binding protein